jgi:predicted chitinase
MQLYFGIVENRSDPLELGRCQVRVVGLHTHDKNLLPTSDLPWCATMQPSTSAAMNGIGYSYVGPVEGTSVVVSYLDDSMQQGIILGAVGGIATEPVPIDFDDSGPILKQDKKTETVALRTIKGPVTGNKITFYDPNNPTRTNVTEVLSANMRVSGFGIENGTTIVSIDSGTEITISTVVRELGENILEFDPPLSNAAQIAASKTNITASTLSEKSEPVKPTPVNNEIPTLPPLPEFKNTQTKASEGIKALISACDKVGLTTKEQKCALLGIAGGESGWIPQLESYSYSKSRIKQIFSFLTDEEADKYSDAKKKGITREEFFSVIYGPTKRGKGFLGNQTDADGGKYFGRGFIQLTGRSNYKKYNDLANKMGMSIDIVNDPDSLDSDINISALVAALYIKDRVPKGVNINAHPDYFFAAKKAVGVNSPDIAARKLKYYEYFYGLEGGGGVSKDAGAPMPDFTDENAPSNPGPSNKSISTGSFGTGFRDPNNKYPLKEYIGESDMNRLARGVIDGTVVKLKDANRKFGVPVAKGLGSWDQPEAPYAAKYPFNKVFETESGHVQEFDDTPGMERINTYHRSGTFTEVDCNGTQVNYIVGDNFVLMETNGFIHVAGECNLTVEGNINIFSRSDANIQVSGNANVEVGNNLDIGVANNVTMAVGSDFDIKVGGQFRVTADEGMEIVTGGSLAVQSDQVTTIKAESIYNQANSSFDAKAGGDMKLTSSSNVHVKGSSQVNVDYGKYNLGTGAAKSASIVAEVDAVSLTPPTAGEPLYPVVPQKLPPERQFEEKATIETPDDWDTPEGRAKANTTLKTEGVIGAPVPVADESAGTPTGGSGKVVEVDKSLILTTKDYTNDFRLSKSISLGMMISGGVGGKHKLQAQMLKATKDGAERLYTVQEIVGNLSETANNILEQIIDVLPGGLSGYQRQWDISSGYRLKGVEKNESPTSDHCKGHCIDIILKLPDRIQKTYELIQKIEPLITYDQLILEYRHPSSVWMHMSYRKDNNRKMAFTMVNDKTYKRNEKGIPAGFYLINDIPPKG